MRPFTPASGGVRVALRVSPGAARDALGPVVPEAGGGAALRVRVTAPAERGRANAAVIALLAEACGLPRSAVTLAAGAGARRKVVHIEGEPEALIRRLEGRLAGPGG